MDARKAVLARVAEGELPLVVEVHRAGELRNLLHATEGFTRLRLILAGATEVGPMASELAERAFCNRCGSSLFWRMTAEGPYKGTTSVTLGSLDDRSGVTLVKEWFIDRKPDGYAMAGERECITEAAALAMLD